MSTTLDGLFFLGLFLALTLSYLLGSVNFAIIITRVFTGKDIRDFGSKNAGMTNVLRTVGKGAAFLTLLGDFSKGLLAVWLTRCLFFLISPQPDFFLGDYLSVCSALLGHCFPIFYGFKGGKGVLVSAGALIALSPLAFAGSFVAFAVAFGISKRISLGSIMAALVFPVMTLLLGLRADTPYLMLQVGLTVGIAALIIVMHRQNVKRLLAGTEPKIGEK